MRCNLYVLRVCATCGASAKGVGMSVPQQGARLSMYTQVTATATTAWSVSRMVRAAIAYLTAHSATMTAEAAGPGELV
jgi:hypothetical protein